MENCVCKNEHYHEPECQHYQSCMPMGTSDFCGGCDHCLCLQDSNSARHVPTNAPFLPVKENKSAKSLSKGETIIYLGDRLMVEEIQDQFVFFYPVDPKPQKTGIVRLPRNVAEFLFKNQQKEQ